MSRKSPLTIDDILGPNIEPSEVSSPKPIQTSNPKLNSKGKSNAGFNYLSKLLPHVCQIVRYDRYSGH